MFLVGLRFSPCTLSIFGLPEKLGRDISQPPWISHTNLSHVLLARLHQLVINYPRRTFLRPSRLRVEKTTRRMDEHLLVVSRRFVSVGRVFSSRVVEETRCNRFTDPSELFRIGA